ncbi:3-oxoacyl-ACP synthase [Massilia dura]|uniref:3-oxoacyl-ACP synthase n=2 Tax=Pseudoduganella dura TaxID=321982 RepID=A0A6I3XMR5_9BURK|nr:3-oxoacyl-[acyl-carrier-protein] synthase III C-terminal domain-containing protein [Pseudoduganella dura]MUI13025.1 3-oxoacyl-ACP synthase [Pseudoduganella dura]
MAVPARQVSSAELDRELGLRTGTTFRQTGVERRFLSTTETAAQLAARACEAALADAGLRWEDIDCLVAASATMDQALPYNAALVHAELGLDHRRTATFDIGASCLSFLAGLDVMSYLVEAGRYRHVMLVSADIATFGLDWTRLKEGGIFGDGAAAVVIRKALPGETGALLSSSMVTLSAGVNHCRIPAGGSRFHPRRVAGPIEPLSLFRMEGKSVFRLVAAELPDFARRLLDQAGTAMDRIAAVVPHQASQLALDHLAKRLGIPDGRLVDIFARYGNQVSASLPTALHLALSEGRVRRGEQLMLIGTGAGLTMGGMVLTY